MRRDRNEIKEWLFGMDSRQRLCQDLEGEKMIKLKFSMVALFVLVFSFSFSNAAEQDILFYAPFDGNSTPAVAGGDKEPVDDSIGEYSKGVKAEAAVTNAANWVKYKAQGNINAGEGTVVMWIKPMDRNALAGSQVLFEAKGEGSNPGTLSIHTNSNKLMLFIFGIGGQTGYNFLPPITDFANWNPGEWHFVVCTWQPEKQEFYVDGTPGNGKLSLYVDGEHVEQRPIKKAFHPKGFSSMSVGKGSSEHKTAIDDLYIYNRALLPKEIKSLYRQQAVDEKSVAGKISFFPSINSLVPEILMGGKRGPSLRLAVADSGGKNIFNKNFQKNDFELLKKNNCFRLRQAVKLPYLEDGIYETWLEAPDKERYLRRNFEVKHYEWEHNSLGKSDVVIPPFTALKTMGNVVEAILRKHYMGNLCLWQQVETLGEPILEEPIALKISKGGKTIPWSKSTPPKIVRADASTVKVVAHSENEFLSVESSAEFDYDGLMKIDLKIIPLKQEPLDRIWLEIPVKEEFATLFHAVGEHCQYNPGREIPAKQGLVFDSRTVHQEHVENFVPYIWIGGEKRGICWVADWDKDWIHSEQRSAVQLFREKDKVVIKVNFINGPVILKRARTLEFAIQASPVKPLPPNWRDLTFDFSKSGRGRIHLFWPGSMGFHHGWASRYPLNHDYSIIHKLDETRKTGKIDLEFINKYVDNILQSSPSIAAAYVHDTEEPAAFYKSILKTRFGYAKKVHEFEPSGKLLHYSVAAINSQTLPEYKIYSEEWQYNNRKTHLTKSFRDYAVWYADKMIEAGMDGTYVDNTYLWAQTGWPVGEGYIGDDGEVHPSLGVWRLRELFKRLATMMHERGIDPFLYIHMTNSKLLPTLSFANAILGWEMKYGTLPYPERFTPDYIRAVNLPFQTGTVSTVLIQRDAGKENDKDADAESIRITRSALALTLPNEIFVYYSSHCLLDIPTAVKARDIISDFRRKNPGFKSYPCWQKNNPVTTPANLLITAYQAEDKLLLVIGNMGKDAKAKIEFNLKSLGYKGIKEAVNLETGESLPTSVTGAELNIKEYDFSLIEVRF